MGHNRVFRNRYEISCSYCGVLDHYRNLADALEQGQYFAEFVHTTDDEVITIFDRLAHRGQAQLYSKNGLVLEYRAH